MSAPDLANWVTLAMTVLTGWMAYETRRMAKVASDSLKASRQPHLALHSIDVAQGPISGPASTANQLGAQITLQLRNPGQVRLTYDVEVADFIINGADGPRGPYENHVGVIFPGDMHAFRLPAIPLAYPLPDGATGTLNFRVRYWAAANERFSLEFTISFMISAEVKWAYQRGPVYA